MLKDSEVGMLILSGKILLGIAVIIITQLS